MEFTALYNSIGKRIDDFLVMKHSIRSFMSEIIDYAGLFPPANLHLDEAIRNYADYKNSKDAWMLSRFIVPASMLPELKPYGEELFKKNPPFDISVLGSSTESVDQFFEKIEQIVEQCLAFHELHGDRVTTHILEMKLPEEAVYGTDLSILVDLMNKVAEQFTESEFLPERVFFEAFLDRNWRENLGTVLQAIARHNADYRNIYHYRHSGFKLRCGGTGAEMFPSTQKVAFALNRARDERVPVKCTAGLHHPVRHYSDSVNTKMHGFFNVFGGAMIAYAHDLTNDELVNILEEDNPDEFRFSGEALSWKDYTVYSGEIKGLREVAMISFGSCSFDEPREDLESLGLL